MARLSIGEFAQESGLTPKALRLYDELGLLEPAAVDPRSGYRFYERHQLERARLVGWLRGLGMPLARIRPVCDLPPAAATAEVISYWRQLEADMAARKELVTFLVEHLSGKETGMTETPAPLRLHHGARTDRGLVRRTNEDVTYAGSSLYAVADGFGAQDLPDTASEAAVRALHSHDADAPAGSLASALGAAAGDAQRAVSTFTSSAPSRENTGTTLTAMLWSGGQLALMHIGDSRAYLLRDGALTRLTHDHTVVQSLIDDGKLTVDEAPSHPQRATLLRALHRDDTQKPDLHLREAQAGDRYLLCSDGVHAVLDERRLHHVLTTTAAPQDAADRITDLVREAGAPDNLCCVVTDVHASS